MSWPTGEEGALASLIWTTSRGDESTISATGANVVAFAIMASSWLASIRAVAWDEGLTEGADQAGDCCGCNIYEGKYGRPGNPYR